jgi:branched-chain amino acid transport system permease protein
MILTTDVVYLLDQFFNGLNVGSIYALVAIGYTMVYGIIRLINFAHGEIMMFGAYFGLYISFLFPNIPFILLILIAMILAAIMGMLIEFLAYRKLRKAARLSALITAIGMSIFLQQLAQLIFGSQYQKYTVSLNASDIVVFGYEIEALTLYTIILSIVFMVLLSLFIKLTKQGKAMRAVSMDKEAAQLMGVNINRIISLTFALGSALGALGGVFYAMALSSQVYPTLGIMPGLKAFIAAVFGGIGNITGAMIGGFAIGLFETFTKAFISSSWVNAIVFSILIFILLFKPTGLLGKNLKEKV